MPGKWSTGGTYSNLSAVAQPGGITHTSGGTIQNYAGFLNTFSLFPALDTDQDGLVDEIDSDNDNDGLTDDAELAGDSFNPNTPTDLNVADSDGDGAADGDEAAAGTDPTDAEALLKITSIAANSPEATIQWRARSGVLYQIRSADVSVTNGYSTLGTTNAAGGTAPWFVITNSFTDASGLTTNRRFYVIRVP